MNWIKVEDSLPEINPKDSVMFLVYGPKIGIVCRPYNEYHKLWDDEDYDDTFTEAIGGLITHWMPLPEKPII